MSIRLPCSGFNYRSMVIVLLCVILLFIQSIQANTEKTIFNAPGSVTLPQDASIDNLLLIPLTPDHLVHRTHINASFPTDERPHGEDTWILLDGLSPGQRYEFRVCWLATQPTTFWIQTYSVSEAFQSPSLMTALSSYSYARHSQLSHDDIEQLHSRRFVSKEGGGRSLLLLRIQAAADYFSLDASLMKQVPQVHVDLILDPYLLNVFPQSLGPTAVYVVAVAILAWFLSTRVFQRLSAVSKAAKQNEEKRSKKLT